jgi:hypothetical protein
LRAMVETRKHRAPLKEVARPGQRGLRDLR